MPSTPVTTATTTTTTNPEDPLLLLKEFLGGGAQGDPSAFEASLKPAFLRSLTTSTATAGHDTMDGHDNDKDNEKDDIRRRRLHQVEELLWLACTSGHVSAVHLLLYLRAVLLAVKQDDNDVDVDVDNDDDNVGDRESGGILGQCLLQAVRRGHLPVVSLLLENGAPVNQQHGEVGPSIRLGSSLTLSDSL